VVDQVSFTLIPLRLLSPRPVLFYCHFPDQLCDPSRAGEAIFAITGVQQGEGGGSSHGSCTSQRKPSTFAHLASPRGVYRAFFDWLEGATMRLATRVVCNSLFSRAVTVSVFPFLNVTQLAIPPAASGIATGDTVPRCILYPPVDVHRLLDRSAPLSDADAALVADLQARLPPPGRRILSINRFERKKNLPLAIEALALARRTVPDLMLIMAGGYDERLRENREHFAELEALATRLGVCDAVVFLRSISDAVKRALLDVCDVVVYTPPCEHFGIVPVEAMAWGKCVVAVNNGGPVESVGADGASGVLCANDAVPFADAIVRLAGDAPARAEMARAAQQRVQARFAMPTFVDRLDDLLHRDL
jgi:alpha-1,3/alpha-1,6-mannosyltransferase